MGLACYAVGCPRIGITLEYQLRRISIYFSMSPYPEWLYILAWVYRTHWILSKT